MLRILEEGNEIGAVCVTRRVDTPRAGHVIRRSNPLGIRLAGSCPVLSTLTIHLLFQPLPLPPFSSSTSPSPHPSPSASFPSSIRSNHLEGHRISGSALTNPMMLFPSPSSGTTSTLFSFHNGDQQVKFVVVPPHL